MASQLAVMQEGAACAGESRASGTVETMEQAGEEVVEVDQLQSMGINAAVRISSYYY